MNRACIALAVVTGVAPDRWAETGWRGIATAEAILAELHEARGGERVELDGEGRPMVMEG